MINEMELLQLDIMGLHTAYKNRVVSPVEVVEVMHERIQKMSHLNAYITVCEEEALQEAEQAEELYRTGQSLHPLLGVPVGLKDLIQTAGIRTTCGSGVFKDFIPRKDAAVVKALKQSGVVILGKQNTHELAYGTTGDDSYFGPMKNPYDERKIAGGSSGGSAAAVSARLGWGALGTDTSGSIRIPASLCGIVGMKPTFGKVSVEGIHPLSQSMDHVGPMTKTVIDNAILFDALAGGSETSRILEETVNLKGKKIGVPTTYFFEGLDDEVEAHVLATIDLLEKQGATLYAVDVDDAELHHAMEISSAIDRSEAYLINLAIVHDESNLLGIETRRRILQGSEYRAYEYAIALALRERLVEKYKAAFEVVDAIIAPTTPIVAPDIGAEEVTIGKEVQAVRGALMRLTFLANYIGIPSLSIPCGIAANGLPIGVQLMGSWNEEKRLYEIAYGLERELELGSVQRNW